MTPGRIAAVITCHDLGRTLLEALESVERQTRPAAEIVVVDGGSTDIYTRQMLARLERTGTRVVQAGGPGASAARNCGAQLTSSEYLVWLDADDVLEPGYFDAAGTRLDAEPDLDFVSCALRAFGAASYVWSPSPPTFVDAVSTGGVPHASTMVRRRLWEKTGGFDESLLIVRAVRLLGHRDRARLPGRRSRPAAAQLPRAPGIRLQAVDPAGDVPRTPSALLRQALRPGRTSRTGAHSSQGSVPLEPAGVLAHARIAGEIARSGARKPPARDRGDGSGPGIARRVAGRHGATSGELSPSAGTGAGIGASPLTGTTSMAFSRYTDPTCEVASSRSGRGRRTSTPFRRPATTASFSRGPCTSSTTSSPCLPSARASCRPAV